jgi:hypothetical protein
VFRARGERLRDVERPHAPERPGEAARSRARASARAAAISFARRLAADALAALTARGTSPIIAATEHDVRSSGTSTRCVLCTSARGTPACANAPFRNASHEFTSSLTGSADVSPASTKIELFGARGLERIAASRRAGETSAGRTSMFEELESM